MQPSHSQANTTLLGALPSTDRPEKIEVQSRVAADGSTLLELVEYSWGSGLGWYVQKRVTLDAGQVDGLRALLSPAQAASPTVRRPLPAIEREGNVTRLLFPG